MKMLCKSIILLASLGSLSACGLTEKIKAVRLLSENTQNEIATQKQNFMDKVDNPKAKRAAQQVARPWLAGKPEPLARELTLPLALRKNVATTLVFSASPPDLPALAQRITRATGIPVHVRADALLPAEQFAPRLAANSSTSLSNLQTLQLSGEPMPLADLLDQICASLGVFWRYQNRRIEFYRTETRVFNVRSLTLGASAEASMGSQRSTSSDGFSSTATTRLNSQPQEMLDVIRARLEPFLSRAGVIAAEPGGSASIVVTDSPEVLTQIANYIDYENRALTRRVRLLFEEITLLSNDVAEAAFDWNLVFSGARLAAAATMPGASNEQAASFGLAIHEGKFQGSDAVVQALGKLGQVVRRSSMPIMTLNRRPVSHAVRTTFSYVDRVETTALSENAIASLPSISVSQREETVGSFLTVVPDAQDDGQILLSLAYDNTVAQPLKTVTFGDRSNPLELQQLTVDGNGTVQQVAVYPGQPLVISGFERSLDETEGRRLNPGFPMVLGGSERVSSQQLSTIIVVTAQVEEGF